MIMIVIITVMIDDGHKFGIMVFDELLFIDFEVD